jgi:hypothetical protein
MSRQTTPLEGYSGGDEWVTLKLHLLNWKWLNQEIRVRTSTPLYALRKKIVEEHGNVSDLVVCVGSFAEANEMHDEMKTLADYGISGALAEHDPPVVCHLYYDFKPSDRGEPLFLASYT